MPVFSAFIGIVIGFVWSFALNFSLKTGLFYGALLGFIVGIAINLINERLAVRSKSRKGEVTYVAGTILGLLLWSGVGIGLLIWLFRIVFV